MKILHSHKFCIVTNIYVNLFILFEDIPPMPARGKTKYSGCVDAVPLSIHF